MNPLHVCTDGKANQWPCMALVGTSRRWFSFRLQLGPSKYIHPSQNSSLYPIHPLRRLPFAAAQPRVSPACSSAPLLLSPPITARISWLPKRQELPAARSPFAVEELAGNRVEQRPHRGSLWRLHWPFPFPLSISCCQFLWTQPRAVIGRRCCG